MQRIKEFIKTNVFELIFYIVFIISIVLKAVLFQGTAKIHLLPQSFAVSGQYIMYFNILFAVALFSFVSIFFTKKKRLFLLIANALVTILLVGDIIYFRYYSSPLTFQLLKNIGVAGDVSQSIFSLFNIKDLLFFADLPILIIFSRCITNKNKEIEKTYNSKLWQRAIVYTIILAISLLGIRTLISQQRVNQTSIALDKNYAVKFLGPYYYHFYDAKSYIKSQFFTNKTPTDQEISMVNEYFNNKEKFTEKFKGIAKDKNLIIVQLESFQGFLIGQKSNGIDVTPNLNKLLEDSISFPNMFFQTDTGNTVDAEMLTTMSIYPPKSGILYQHYTSSNTKHSLASLLKNQGYTANVYHAFEGSFWNRSEAYEYVGYDKFYSLKDFEYDINKDKLSWALNDKDFFLQSANLIDKDKKTFSLLVSLSTHHPFSPFSNKGKLTENIGDNVVNDIEIIAENADEKDKTDDYINSARYLDKAIGSFIDTLKENGMYDNSVIVFYGDHAGMKLDDRPYLFNHLGQEDNEYNYLMTNKTNCIIHIPSKDKKLKKLKGKQISTICGEIDIMPTLANLMDINAPYTIGKDLLNTKEDNGYAVLPNGTVITDKYTYIGTDDYVYIDGVKSATNLDTNNQYYDEIKRYQKELEISNILITKDFFNSNFNLLEENNDNKD